MILASEKCINNSEHNYIKYKSSQGFFSVGKCLDDLKILMKNNIGITQDKITSILTLGPGYDGCTMDYKVSLQDSIYNNPYFNTMCDLFPWTRYTVYQNNVCQNK